MVNDDQRFADYLQPTPFVWKRPDGPPRVWRVINGRRKMPNGEIPRFSIQEVPEELKEDVVNFMMDNFIPEETTCVNRNMSGDPVGMREMRTVWRDVLNIGISIVALLVSPDPEAKPVIAGTNVLMVISPDDVENSSAVEQVAQFRSENMKTIFYMQSVLSHEADVFKSYGVDKYLGALGLSVHPNFRGQALGEELLRTRDEIGLKYNISVSETIFTGVASQTLATRVGFEVLRQQKYTDILDHKGNVAFPGVTVEFMKVMGKRLNQHEKSTNTKDPHK